LLPTAVTAAVRPDAAAPLALCSAAGGSPTKHDAALPVRHCALCGAGPVFSLSPSRHGFLTTRRLAGAAHPSSIASRAPSYRPPFPGDAQPRAPPPAA
jgi:hypothetical protein